MSQHQQSEPVNPRVIDLASALEGIAAKMKKGEIKADAICLLFVSATEERENDFGKFAISSYINGIQPEFTPTILQAASAGFSNNLDG